MDPANFTPLYVISSISRITTNIPLTSHSANDYTEALEESKSKLIVIDFFAEWCGSSHSIPYFSLLILLTHHRPV